MKLLLHDNYFKIRRYIKTFLNFDTKLTRNKKNVFYFLWVFFNVFMV